MKWLKLVNTFKAPKHPVSMAKHNVCFKIIFPPKTKEIWRVHDPLRTEYFRTLSASKKELYKPLSSQDERVYIGIIWICRSLYPTVPQNIAVLRDLILAPSRDSTEALVACLAVVPLCFVPSVPRRWNPTSRLYRCLAYWHIGWLLTAGDCRYQEILGSWLLVPWQADGQLEVS